MLLCGGGLVVTTLTGSGSSTWVSAACNGGLAAVLGPVFDAMRSASGVVLTLLGAAGVAAGAVALRQPVTLATRLLLLAYGLAFGLVAILSGLGMAAPHRDLMTSFVAFAFAATLALLHVAAAGSRETRVSAVASP